MLGLGHMVRLRVAQQVLETLDSIRFGHLLQFARGTGKQCPWLERIAEHPDADIEVDPDALVHELQALALERPPENVAPLIGLLRNDAIRVRNLSLRHTAEAKA
jgi:hypothetical protein